MMKTIKENKQLEAFLLQHIEATGKKNASGSGLFRFFLAGFMALAMTAAFLLGKVDISGMKQIVKLRKMDVSFLMKEKEKPLPEIKKEVVEKKKEIKKASLKEEIRAADMMPEKKTVTRKIYGVRKVYSRGLGSGYGGGDAVVAKLGNSLDVPPDTIKATTEDLKGELVSVTKVSSMPKIIQSYKPEYTKEMREANVSGKVSAKVLVDVDGTAKKIIIIRDLGYGTRDSSIVAIKKMRFQPGTLDNSPVAVWIPLTFRFELQA